MARKLDSLGESPADAFERMRREAADQAILPAPPDSEPQGVEIEGELSPQQIREIAEETEGFGVVEDPIVVEDDTPVEPPSPEKAIAMIQTLSETNQQLKTELDAAYSVIEDYKAKYGEID